MILLCVTRGNDVRPCPEQFTKTAAEIYKIFEDFFFLDALASLQSMLFSLSLKFCWIAYNHRIRESFSVISCYIKCQIANVECQMSNSKYRRSNVQYLIFNVK